MPQIQAIEKPTRWDQAFGREVPDPTAGRDMTETDMARLMAMEPFSNMDPGLFPRKLPLAGILQYDTRLQRYRHGDVIVRQGDYGNSAFLILDGAVRVILEGLAPEAVGRHERKRKSWIRSVADLITNPSQPEVRDTRLYERSSAGALGQSDDVLFVQDVTNLVRTKPDLFETTENIQMQAGALFGELAALGRTPRTATVVAEGDTELLEIRWQGLRDLRKYDPKLREHVDAQFRRFGLASALRAAPLLAHLSDADAEALAETAEFETYGSFDWYGSFQQLRKKQADLLSKEPIIAEEGHYPNGLVMIRSGFARLSRRHGHGEQTFSYLGKGDVYGLAELARNARGQDRDQVPLRSTLRAIGYVDVVRIPTRAFEQLILPRIPADLIPRIEDTTDDPATTNTADSPDLDAGLLEFLVENRFINGTAAMMIDMDRCTHCDDCVRACASGHDNNPRFVRHGPVFGKYMVANACMHCVDPVCMIGCPTGAIHRDQETGNVQINDRTCIGCQVCAASCPYDNIRMVPIRDRKDEDVVVIDPAQGQPIVKATKCDLCTEHLGGPACQRACPHDALRRVDMRDLPQLARWTHR